MNLSYCRFENTYSDLMDCYEAMGSDDLSELETRYRQKLIALAKDIVDDFGDDDGQEKQEISG